MVIINILIKTPTSYSVIWTMRKNEMWMRNAPYKQNLKGNPKRVIFSNHIK